MINNKILIVDDEPIFQLLVQKTLKRYINYSHYSLVRAADGKEALKKLEEDISIKIIITDINTPKIDGFTLLESIQKLNQDYVTIVISNYTDIKNIKAAMNRGAFDFLTKPFDLEDLIITLNKAIKYIQETHIQQKELEKLQKRILYQSSHDFLTGLPNRASLIKLIEDSLEISKQNKNYLFGILFIDIDRFKLINDSLGHLEGDLLLKSVGKELQKYIRHSYGDKVARLGGDEFVVLLNNLDSTDQGIKIAQEIQAKLNNFLQSNKCKFSLTTSMGIAFNNIQYQYPEEMLRDADIAMYRSKNDEQGCYKIFDMMMQKHICFRLGIENALYQAIDNQEFDVHYQPIFSLSTKKLVGFEALIRWNNSRLGWIPPNQFIPIAEETGFIKLLGQWVFTQVCQQLCIWQQEFKCDDLVININFSAIQLGQHNLVENLQEIIEQYQVNPHNLKLELTESCILSNVSRDIEVLHQLKAIGLDICIDDFGIGYSSLSRLHEFPITTLKIDKSFIKNLSYENMDTVKMIISLAHSLNMNVVAEGIEEEIHLEILESLNCEFGQGYLFSKPLPSADAFELISQRINSLNFSLETI